MADIKLSRIIGGDGGGGFILAPDLTFPSDLLVSNGYKQITGIDATSGLTTALSLTGKFAISHAFFFSFTAETVTLKLTIDGKVIMNDTYTSGTSQLVIGNESTSDRDHIISTCEDTFLLEIQTATDTSIILNYVARPIV